MINLWLEIEKYLMRQLRAIIFFILLSFIVLFTGCSKQPEIIPEVEYQEVRTPVSCPVELPEKPKYDPKRLETMGFITIYYKEVETTLKACQKR